MVSPRERVGAEFVCDGDLIFEVFVVSIEDCGGNRIVFDENEYCDCGALT